MPETQLSPVKGRRPLSESDPQVRSVQEPTSGPPDVSEHTVPQDKENREEVVEKYEVEVPRHDAQVKHVFPLRGDKVSEPGGLRPEEHREVLQ